MNKYLKNADSKCRVRGKFSNTTVFELILRKNKILYKRKLLEIFRLSYLSEEILARIDGWIQKITYQLFLT
jgi:hypothetical protein